LISWWEKPIPSPIPNAHQIRTMLPLHFSNLSFWQRRCHPFFSWSRLSGRHLFQPRRIHLHSQPWNVRTHKELMSDTSSPAAATHPVCNRSIYLTEHFFSRNMACGGSILTFKSLPVKVTATDSEFYKNIWGHNCSNLQV
jgi:hypothetical protein